VPKRDGTNHDHLEGNEWIISGPIYSVKPFNNIGIYVGACVSVDSLTIPWILGMATQEALQL
jgi:hypothetical protein